MNVHKNALLTPTGREALVTRVLGGESVRKVAREVGVSERTAHKWLRRYRQEGRAGLFDRSSRPHRSPLKISARTHRRIVSLRRKRLTGAQIAKRVGVSASTVSRVLREEGISRMRELDPPEPDRRYQRAHPGELLHLDTKKLGRFRRPGHRVTGNRRVDSVGAGWEFVHVAIDDRSRLAYTEVHPDERAETATAFLEAVVSYYARFNVRIERVMTDNGSCYRSKVFQAACRRLGIRHLYTRPYRPRTNGKAERFIQTALREWAYARKYRTSDQRAGHLAPWVHQYNWHRPHGSLGGQAPVSVLDLRQNNLLTLHS